jgi:triosephosphate isomerase
MHVSEEDAPLIAAAVRKGGKAKTKSQCRKMPILGGGNRTENLESIVRKPPLQGIVQKPPLLSGLPL